MNMLAIRGLSALIVSASIGCGGSSDDHQHEDAISADEGVVDARSDEGGADVANDATSDAACSPACASGQLCCLDAHGHNPACVTTDKCP